MDLDPSIPIATRAQNAIISLILREIQMATEPTKPRLFAHHGHKTWTSAWRDDQGRRRTKRLGKENEVPRKLALMNWKKWREEEWVKDSVRNPDGGGRSGTCQTLALDYLGHAKTMYRKNGKLTTAMYAVSAAMVALAKLGPVAVDRVTAPMIADLRDSMVNGTDGLPISRMTVNDKLAIIKSAFRWAREKGKIPAEVCYDVCMVTPLRAGRSAAKEPTEVKPVAWETVRATLPHCHPMLAAMIQVQIHTGMRPDEVCQMRGCDIEAGGDIWIYRPQEHKTEKYGHKREICLGPKAQEAIKSFLALDTQAYLFQPSAAPKVIAKVRERYRARSYRQAIHRACRRAKVEPWNPNQLRHTAATLTRKYFSVEEACIQLGHSTVRMTERYAERDREKAMDVARKIG